MWQTIIWFLFWGGLFYFMMRMGGCCGHVHGGHHSGHSEGHDSGRAAIKDPVCGMEETPEKAAATTMHEGTTYYFCSTRCHDMFVDNHEKYVPSKTQDLGVHHV